MTKAHRMGVARASRNATSLLKTLFLGAGLALATATPPLAQSYDPDVGSGNVVPSYGQASPWGVVQSGRSTHSRTALGNAAAARNAFARVGQGAAASRPLPVTNELGNVVGTDPDPNIQLQLNRESLQGRP
jgi:hypothetical protein